MLLVVKTLDAVNGVGEAGLMLQKAFYSVKEFSDILGVPRTTGYNLVKDGEVRSVVIRGAIRVSAKAVAEFIDSVEALETVLASAAA